MMMVNLLIKLWKAVVLKLPKDDDSNSPRAECTIIALFYYDLILLLRKSILSSIN
jgi:hypothetical protein